MKPVRFSDYARLEIARRDIPFEIVEQVPGKPEQVVPEHGGLAVRQSRVELEGKLYLVRVVVSERPDEDLAGQVGSRLRIATRGADFGVAQGRKELTV